MVYNHMVYDFMQLLSIIKYHYRCSGITPNIIIILVDYLIPIQWANGQEVAWFIPLADWRLNLCPELIATIRREMLTGACNLP
jgi:hypothetical protein